MKKINYYIGKIVYKTIESRIIEDSSEENVVYATKYVKADKYSLLYSYDDETLVNTEQFDVVPIHPHVWASLTINLCPIHGAKHEAFS